jgi:hypothetical protein
MNELFPLTKQELVMWKLEYCADVAAWKRQIHCSISIDPTEYISIESHIVKWVIELDRTIPGTVVYVPCGFATEADIYLEDIALGSVAVYVAGVYTHLITNHQFSEVRENAHQHERATAPDK